jgi:hypothetical protein
LTRPATKSDLSSAVADLRADLEAVRLDIVSTRQWVMPTAIGCAGLIIAVMKLT